MYRESAEDQQPHNHHASVDGRSADRAMCTLVLVWSRAKGWRIRLKAALSRVV